MYKIGKKKAARGVSSVDYPRVLHYTRSMHQSMYRFTRVENALVIEFD